MESRTIPQVGDDGLYSEENLNLCIEIFEAHDKAGNMLSLQGRGGVSVVARLLRELREKRECIMVMGDEIKALQERLAHENQLLSNAVRELRKRS